MRKISYVEIAAASIAVIILTVQLVLSTGNVIQKTSLKEISNNQSAYSYPMTSTLNVTNVDHDHGCKR